MSLTNIRKYILNERLYITLIMAFASPNNANDLAPVQKATIMAGQPRTQVNAHLQPISIIHSTKIFMELRSLPQKLSETFLIYVKIEMNF